MPAKISTRTVPIGACLTLLLALVMGCGSSGILTDGRTAVEPTARERVMLDDYKDGKLDQMSALEAALIVGGPRDAGQLDATVRALDAALNAAIAAVDSKKTGQPLPGWIAAIDAPRRARALLAALFSEHGGRALLKTYEADATTLYDVAATGRYNCVSATTLYLLAAARMGIEARPVLLPSHARAVVIAGGRHIVVETTNPSGFDPPPAVLEEMRNRARLKSVGKVDLYADEHGTEVDFGALLAATYGNISIMSYARGDTELTTALLSREAALTPPAVLPFVRTQQMALLSQLATRRFDEGRLDEALGFARRAATVAMNDEGKRLAAQTLAAIASRKLLEQEARMNDAVLTAFAEPLRPYPTAWGDVQAQVLTLVAQRKSKRGDADGSAAALREAAAASASPEMKTFANRNVLFGDLGRVAKLSQSDADAASAAYAELAPPPAGDPELTKHWREVGAAIRQNKVALLAKRVDALVRASRCLDARPLIAEGHWLAPDEKFFAQAAAFCAGR